MIAARSDAPVAAAGDGFACPMHPQVTTTTPSDCPICGMALEQVRSVASASAPLAGAVRGSSSSVLESSIGSLRLERVTAALVVLAWAESRDRIVAVVDNDDLRAVPPTEVGWFQSSRRESARIPVRRTRDHPSPWGHSSSRASFAVAGTPSSIQRGEIGTLHFGPHGREVALIPEAAIVSSPEGPHVLVVSDDRASLTRRRVETGKTTSGAVSLLSGIGERDLIVTRNAFFFDAERRLRETSSEPGPDP